jgi:hypothetical protein
MRIALDTDRLTDLFQRDAALVTVEDCALLREQLVPRRSGRYGSLDRERLLEILQCLLLVALPGIGQPDVVESARFADSITRRSPDG